MSVFGQVWVYSAAAFVLGAVLAWLFLARPAQRRARELQRRLAAETSSGTAPSNRGTASRTMVTPTPSGADDEHADQVAPATRRFEPASRDEPEPAPQTVTEHLEPSPIWPERDSLQGAQGRGRANTEIDELDEDFALLDEFDEQPQGELSAALDPQGPEDSELTGMSGSLEAPERSADVDPPTEYRSSQGGDLDLDAEEQQTGSSARMGGSLFEPPATADVPEKPEGKDGPPPTYAFGGGPSDADEDTDEDATERTTLLPKRKPGRSQMESFEPPGPAQPSMRPTARRDQEPEAGRGSSLFEPATTPPPARGVGRTELPGPFGPGSAMPKPGGQRPGEDFTVKASVTSLRYCAEGSPEFPRMVAEVWFRTPADAERVGFRPLS